MVIAKIIEYSAKNKLLVLLLTGLSMLAAYWCLKNMPLDAIPDLSDTQVIIYSKWDRSPDIIEDQVTYPIVSALVSTPNIKAVRGVSDFGYSYVYVIFEDGTNPYWARSRVLEYLSKITPRLPEGVRSELGPDATSLGWIYQYVLVDESKRLNNAQLKSIQDWQIKFHLQSVPGVAEVAGLGGQLKQYQISVDPNKLGAFGLGILDVAKAVRSGNSDASGRVLEVGGREYMLRGRGYLKSVEDIEKIVISSDAKSGTPILVKNVADVQLGSEMRRGVSDFNGLGDTAGGIVLMRQGENVINVIERVKTKLKEIEVSLPQGVKIIPTYDRSELVYKALDTLKHELILEVIIVSLIILIFLWHFPSALVPILTIPVSVFLAFIPMYLMGVTSNIMSLAGIAISIGVLVDGAIVEVENAYKRLEQWQAGGKKGDFHLVRLNALKEVGPSVFFSLLVIAVSFLPVFMLVDQEGRLFKPLAISKTLAMALAALLAVTLDPALRMLFSRMEPFKFKSAWFNALCNKLFVGTYYPEEKHPVTRVLVNLYEPLVHWVLEHRRLTLLLASTVVLFTIPVSFRLGSEFMPPLQEGAFLYMPTAFPGISISEAKRILQIQGKLIKEFPEVETVHGKAGRAETATDVAPLSMFETLIALKPISEWKETKSYEELQKKMNDKLNFAGMPNIWTMPIKNRIDMLSTGIRTPIGIKVLGADLKVIQKLGENIESAVKNTPGTRTAYAERAADGYYLDFKFDRDKLARYGVSIDQANMIVSSAMGGENITYTIEGRERYPVNLRYARDFREDLESLKRVLVPSGSGVQIPVAQLASLELVEGPSMIRDEAGMLAAYVYVDTDETDLGGYIARLKRKVASEVKLPEGYNLIWSGQFENMQRVEARLKLVVPLTVVLVILLLYFNTGSWVKSMIVLLAVPFSLVGSLWLLYILGYHLSIAVWVGMIALMGLDAETGVFMLLYLDLAYEEHKRKGLLKSELDLRAAIIEGAAKRVRPKLMTVAAAFMGLVPIMFASSAGSDVMKRIAAPMIGGLFTSFILELLVYPVVYYQWKRREI